jgi:hypothetical protein
VLASLGCLWSFGFAFDLIWRPRNATSTSRVEFSKRGSGILSLSKFWMRQMLLVKKCGQDLQHLDHCDSLLCCHSSKAIM